MRGFSEYVRWHGLQTNTPIIPSRFEQKEVQYLKTCFGMYDKIPSFRMTPKPNREPANRTVGTEPFRNRTVKELNRLEP